MPSCSVRRLLLLVFLLVMLLPPWSAKAAAPGFLPFTLESTGQEVSWIPGDPHHHSTYSDGRATVQQVMEKAGEAGLGWVFFTDHRQAMNAAKFARQLEEIRAASEATGVLGMMGEENGSRNVEGTNGHILLFNFKAHDIEENSITETEFLARLPVAQPDDPVFGVLAHPMDKLHPWQEWGPRLIGGMELINGMTDRGGASAKTLRRWDWYLGHHLIDTYLHRHLAVGTAGSDSHTAAVGGELPVTYLALPAGYDELDVLTALRCGRAVASSRQGLLADLTINGTPVGSVVGLRHGEPLRFKARFAYGDGSYPVGLQAVQLIRGGVNGATTVINDQGRKAKNPLANQPPEYEFALPYKSARYLFAPSYYRLAATFVVKIKDKLVPYPVYTNPVYIKPLNVPVCVHFDPAAMAVTGTNPKGCLSYSLALDPSIAELKVRVALESFPPVKTGVRVVLHDGWGNQVVASDILGQGKELRRVAEFSLPVGDLPPGSYRLTTTAENGGPGTGKVLARGVYLTWR